MQARYQATLQPEQKRGHKASCRGGKQAGFSPAGTAAKIFDFGFLILDFSEHGGWEPWTAATFGVLEAGLGAAVRF